MADWHFDVTIKVKCIEIEDYCIHWTGEDWIKAIVYGLEAIKKETREHTIANLFIRFQNRVYQTGVLKEVDEIIQLLSKEKKYEEYEDKMRERRHEERKKALAKKKKMKGKVRKLNVIVKPKAA